MHGITLGDHLAQNAAKCSRLYERFGQIFCRSLADFWDNLTGFDVVVFDRFIGPGENESTADAVKRKYGEEALALVKGLIS